MANEAPKIGLDNVVIAKVISDDAGGIVYDSEPEREFTETCEKLGALIDTLTK